MEFTAKQIAQFVQGVIEGDENASVTTFTKIEEGVLGAISFLVSIFKFYKDIDKRIDKRIDERIDARIKPSLDVLQETVTVVKSLEHTVAEMNATLNILKEILLAHEQKK